MYVYVLTCSSAGGASCAAVELHTERTSKWMKRCIIYENAWTYVYMLERMYIDLPLSSCACITIETNSKHWCTYQNKWNTTIKRTIITHKSSLLSIQSNSIHDSHIILFTVMKSPLTAHCTALLLKTRIDANLQNCRFQQPFRPIWAEENECVRECSVTDVD